MPWPSGVGKSVPLPCKYDIEYSLDARRDVQNELEAVRRDLTYALSLGRDTPRIAISVQPIWRARRQPKRSPICRWPKAHTCLPLPPLSSPSPYASISDRIRGKIKHSLFVQRHSFLFIVLRKKQATSQRVTSQLRLFRNWRNEPPSRSDRNAVARGRFFKDKHVPLRL